MKEKRINYLDSGPDMENPINTDRLRTHAHFRQTCSQKCATYNHTLRFYVADRSIHIALHATRIPYYNPDGYMAVYGGRERRSV